MNRLLFHVKWLLCTFLLVAQWSKLSADPNEALLTCPTVTGHTVSCVNQLETYMTAPVAGYSYAWNVSSGGTLSTATGPSTLVNWNVAGAQFVVLISTDPGGAIMNCTLNVTVYPRPTPAILTDFISDCPDKKHEQNIVVPQEREDCWVVCEYTVVNYWTTNVPGNTYNWVIVGGTPVTGTGSSIAVTWGAAGSGTVILTETAPGGCSETVEQCVKIVESPKALFTFNGQDPAAGSLKICLGQTVYFADQSVGAAYWLWDFGDGTSSTLQNPSHPYNTPGTYYGTLTVKNECGCTDVLPFKIIVSDQVSPEIGCISTVCLKDCAFYSVSNLGNCPGAIVTWTVQGGQIINQPNSTSINVIWDDYDTFIKNNGYGLICATVTGCPDLCDGEVCVRVPVIHEAHINGDQVVCVGDAVTYSVPVLPGINEPGNPQNGVDFDWSISGGGAIISPSPYSNTITVAWTTPGTYTVDMASYENYLTNSDCKFDPDPITVTVKPSFSISPEFETICPGTSQTFTLSGTGTFNWTVTGPGGVSGPFTGGNSYTVSPSAPGVYAVSAVSTSGVYCDVEPTAILKVLPAPPTPVGTLNGTVTVCPNTPYVYTLSTPPPPGTVYVWEITGGTLYGGAGQTVTAQWSGIPPMILTVKTKITQDPFCLSAPLNFTINNYTPPATFVTGMSATACVNETKPFWITGLSNYTNLVWSVSPDTAGSVVSGQGTPNIDVLFNTSAPSVVQIVCTATVCGMPITDQFAVNITQIPAYAINAPLHNCQYAPLGLSVSPTAGIAGYSWSFGDGGTSTSATPSHPWTTATTFPITAQLTLNICGNPTITVAKTIIIDPVPVAFVTASNGYVICAPTVTSTTLTAAAQMTCTYQWVGGPSGPLYTVTTPGIYTVIATDPVSGCTSSVVTEVVGCGNCTSNCISATLPWTFTPTENCDSYTFTPNITGATFSSWDFGDGTFSGVAGTVSHTYAHPGYYQVRLTTIDPVNGCVMRVLQTITVKFKGGFSVNYSCASGSMQTILTDLSEYLPGVTATPTWYDGVTAIGTGSVFTTTLTGTHTIKLSVTIGAQTCYSPPQTFNVPAMPVAMFTHDAPKCEGVPVQFSNGSTGSFIGYSWAFGDLATSGVFSPDRTYIAPPTTYTVTLTLASSWGCTSTDTATITIHQSGAPPTLTIAPSPTVCEGTPMTITATGGYTTYAWFNSVAPAITIGTANPFSPTLSGTYGVNATDTNGCPYNVMAAPVVFLPPPYVQIVGKIEYCPGEEISLSADIGTPGFTYSWTSSTPQGTYTSSLPTISHPGNIPGVYTYTVTITHTASGCTNSGTQSVVVHPAVTGLTITSSANCEPATLTASGVGAVSYNWNTGDNTPSVFVEQKGFYSVVATNIWGCTASADYTLEGRPDLSNVMTGCYEYCEPVVWQAINCGGCSYQWYLNGALLPGETNPTINIATSGSYTVVVSNGPGCETESDPIDISIASTPDLCHKCDVDAKDAKFECVGIDPATGNPIYAFTIYVTNNGGALSGLTAVSSFGSVVIDDPVGGFIPGGGAVTPVSGHLIWDGSTMNGCVYFTGLLLEDCQVLEKCEFKWCGELPKCCDAKCELRVVESRVECIGHGFYNVTITIVNNGCTLFNAFIKTDVGIYPLTPSTLPGSAASIVHAILPLSPGSQGIAICGYQFNGERCCVETKLEVPPCEDPHCVMDIKTISVTCNGRNTAGHYVYHFNFDVYGAPAGSSFVVIPNGTGLVSGVSSSCIPGVCNVQGNFESYSATDVACFTILAITSTNPPEVCWGEKCVELPPCPSAKPADGRNEKQVNKTIVYNMSGFTLAPNPAFNEVTILPADQSVKAVQIIVTDMVGQSKMVVNPTGNNPTLDISHLPAGIYNVSITDANGLAVSKKLVVLRN